MNVASLEIGWLLTNTSYDELASDEDDYFICESRDWSVGCCGRYEVETHPFDSGYVFVKHLSGVDHLRDSEPEIGVEIRRFLKERNPKIVIEWGIIETER